MPIQECLRGLSLPEGEILSLEVKAPLFPTVAIYIFEVINGVKRFFLKVGSNWWQIFFYERQEQPLGKR
jgi:hypothetical protein